MIRNLTAGVVIAVLAATSVAAQDAVLWKNVGNWEVSIDPTISHGCYAVAEWNGGTVLRIGLNPEEDNFYFLIGNPKWSSLQPSTNYDMQIRFDTRAPWDVSAVGLQFNPGEVVYLHAKSTKYEFIQEFKRANRMKISYGGRDIDTLRLTGSSRAFSEVEACQKDVATRGAVSATDPFATGGSGKSDNAVAAPRTN